MKKIKQIVDKAHKEFEEGKPRKAIMSLVDYSDTHIKSQQVKDILEQEIRNKEWNYPPTRTPKEVREDIKQAISRSDVSPESIRRQKIDQETAVFKDWLDDSIGWNGIPMDKEIETR